MLVIVVALGLAALFPPETLACEPCTPKARGAAVVRQVVDKIKESEIFLNDHKFLCRIAWVQSKFGLDDNTFVGFRGGIWQVKIFK